MLPSLNVMRCEFVTPTDKFRIGPGFAWSRKLSISVQESTTGSLKATSPALAQATQPVTDRIDMAIMFFMRFPNAGRIPQGIALKVVCFQHALRRITLAAIFLDNLESTW